MKAFPQSSTSQQLSILLIAGFLEQRIRLVAHKISLVGLIRHVNKNKTITGRRKGYVWKTLVWRWASVAGHQAASRSKTQDAAVHGYVSHPASLFEKLT